MAGGRKAKIRKGGRHFLVLVSGQCERAWLPTNKIFFSTESSIVHAFTPPPPPTMENTQCRAVETATMRIGVKTLAKTSGPGVTGAAGEGRALASNRLQIYTFLLSIPKPRSHCIALTSLIFIVSCVKLGDHERDRAQFFGKNSVRPKFGDFGQNGPKLPENGPFRKYLKICSLFFF